MKVEKKENISIEVKITFEEEEEFYMFQRILAQEELLSNKLSTHFHREKIKRFLKKLYNSLLN